MDFCITENCTPDEKGSAMTEFRRGRRRKFTLEFLLTVPDKLRKGATAKEIAESVGGEPSTLLELCRRNKITLPSRHGSKVRALIHVRYSTVMKAREKARKLGLSHNELFERLLDIIAEDNMFDAVLDDG